MDKELKNKLERFARERANEVYDIDMDQLVNLVIDGGKWMLNEIESKQNINQVR